MILLLISFSPSCLCSSQLTLSEDDRLRMKLEFQKCLSVMDCCLVLPHAVSRTKLHNALAAWRKDSEQQMVNTYNHTYLNEAVVFPEPVRGLELF